jgi:hypothetical protein
MSSGPTQNYDDTALGQWQPHPALAVCVRVLVVALPPLGAIVLGLASARWASAERLGMNLWVWLAAEIAASTVLLLVPAINEHDRGSAHGWTPSASITSAGTGRIPARPGG